MGQPVISIKNLSVEIDGNLILENLSLDINKGEFVALLGDNGSGKSTLIKTIVGVIKPTEGEVLINGKLSKISSPQQAMRQNIVSLFQDPALPPDLTTYDALFLGNETSNRIAGIPFKQGKGIDPDVRTILRQLNINYVNHTTQVSSLSGGQQKLLSIARMLIRKPKIILLDEPTAALGHKQKDILKSTLLNLKNKAVVIYITHSLDEVLPLASRVVVLRNKRVVINTFTDRISKQKIQRYLKRG